MLRQYHDIKKRYPGTILFFRLGDFYEMFFEDALVGARELEITLTARHKDAGNPIPMCGVPYHAATGYIAKLVRKGYRVAICEQTEDPKSTLKLVRRDVVRVITPGTALESQLLESKRNNYLGALCGAGEGMGLAILDLSTGEFLTTQFKGEDAWDRINEQLEIFDPREILYPNSLAPLIRTRFGAAEPLSPLDPVIPDGVTNGAKVQPARHSMTGSSVSNMPRDSCCRSSEFPRLTVSGCVNVHSQCAPRVPQSTTSTKPSGHRLCTSARSLSSSLATI